MREMLKPYGDYKETEYDWLGSVPKYWKKTSIGNITELSNKRNGERTDLELLSVYREYGVIKKTSRDDNHNVESEDLSNYKYVDKGYLVLNKMKVWQGSLGVSKYEGIVSPAYIVCKLRNDLNPDFVNHLLRAAVFKTIYNRLSYGVRIGQWDMRYDDFKNIKIYIPSVNEQDQIVKYLDSKLSKINRLIKAKKKKIVLLEDQKHAIISEAVTKGIDPYVKMKPSGIEWLGKIPVGWEVKALRHFLKPVSIKNRPDLPLLSVVREQGVIVRDTQNYQENHNFIPDNLSGYKVVSQGQFVVNKMKAWQGSFGVSIYNGIVSPAYYVFDLNFSNKEYFHYAIRSKVYVNFFGRASDGIRIGQWDLSLQKMKDIPITIPPEDEQQRIVEHISRMVTLLDKAIERTKSKMKLITEYRTTLISDVVTGKVDVRDIKLDDIEQIEEFEPFEVSDEEVIAEEEVAVGEEV